MERSPYGIIAVLVAFTIVNTANQQDVDDFLRLSREQAIHLKGYPSGSMNS